MKITLLNSSSIPVGCAVLMTLSFVLDQALAQSFQVVSTATSTIPTSKEVTFSCTFQNNWSSANHPRLYPTATAHWSPPVLTTHDSGYSMWLPGGLASPGVESVAEIGATTSLVNEIASAGSAIRSSVRGVDQFNSEQQEQVLPSITADASHRLMSSITMVAPSPDWFTGFYDFELVDPDTDTWWSSFTLNTPPFDAGTEQGTTYALSNAAEDPVLPIQEFTATSPMDTGVFLSPDESSVIHVATWECLLQSPVPAPAPTGSEPTSAPNSPAPSTYFSWFAAAAIVLTGTSFTLA
jgi:Spondin_N